MSDPEQSEPHDATAASNSAPQESAPQDSAPPESAPQESEPASHRATGTDADRAPARKMADPTTMRRAPRYGRFAITGVIFGIVVSAAAVLLFAEPTQYINLLGVFLIVTAFLAPVCALLACVLALLIERRRSPRTRTTSKGR